MSYEDAQIRDGRRFLAEVEDHASRNAPMRDLNQIEGTDSSGVVHTVVDINGALLRVSLEDSWWEKIGQHAVGAAIVHAVRAAKDKAAVARMLLEQHGRQAPEPPYDPASLFTDMPHVPLPDYDSPRFDAALVRTLKRAEQILTNADRFSRLQSAPRTVSGSHGLFQLVVIGARINEARVNTLLVGPDSGPDLAADALEVFQSAQSPAGSTGAR